MANQKAVRYFLIAGVTVVWGLIIYRVADGLSGDDALPAPAMAAVHSSGIAAPAAGYTLIADYPDPFIPGADSTKTPAGVGPDVAQTVAPASGFTAPPPPDPDAYREGMVQYLGMMANPEKKLKIASLTIKGTDHLVREGETVMGFKVKKIEPGKVMLIYRGKGIEVSKH